VAAALLLAALAPGCWFQAGEGPARRADGGASPVTPATVAGLEVAWTATVGPLPAEAVVDPGAVYVASQGTLAAFDLTTGAERWSYGDAVADTPALVGGRLHVGYNCTLVSIDPATGAASHSASYDPIGFGVPNCLGGDTLGVDGRVVVPWETGFSIGGAYPACNRGDTLVESGPGFAAFEPGAAGEPAVQVAGRNDLVRRCLAPGQPDTGYHVTAGPLSADAAFLLVPQGRRLHGVARGCAEAQCPAAWTVDVGAEVVGPAVALANGDLAVPTASAGVVVLDGTTHTVAWTGTLPAPLAQPLAASRTTIVAATTDGTVAALPAGGCGAPTCGPAWTAALPAPASARPSLAGGVAWVGGDDGTLTALPADGCGAATCDPLWSTALPAEVTGAPVVSAGTVVVSTADGTVTALRLPPP
jgi:outer membrane protein assembly factor BamB